MYVGIAALRALVRLFGQGGAILLAVLVVANIALMGLGFSSQHPLPSEPQAASEPPALRLVSEMTESSLPEPAATQFICRTWGPRSNLEDFGKVRAYVEEQGGSSRIREVSVYSEPDFLVYVGEVGKSENARRLLEELKSQSIDSALITRGPYNNTISVGVFSREQRADLQRSRVAQLGYEVGVERIDRSYSVYHLEARVPVGFQPDGVGGEACADIAQAH